MTVALGYGNYCAQDFESYYSPNKTSIVLTIAQGDDFWAAQRFAQKYKLPLVTIFHDWVPDRVPNLHKPFIAILEWRFRQLYHRSNLALCVSEGMKNALGSHGNSQVFYPMPQLLEEKFAVKRTIESDTVSSPLRVLYSGKFFDYGPMLAQLLEVTKNHPQVQIQVPQVQIQVRGSAQNY